ncbi:hypothetical protein P3L10_019852 [Capsicum annuum]
MQTCLKGREVIFGGPCSNAIKALSPHETIIEVLIPIYHKANIRFVRPSESDQLFLPNFLPVFPNNHWKRHNLKGIREYSSYGSCKCHFSYENNRICDHREEFCALHEKVSSLEVFLKNFEKYNVSGEMTDSEVEIKEVANAVEYTIQLRLTETVLGENKSQNKKARQRFRQSQQQVAEDMEFLKNFEKYNVSREVTDFEVEVKEVANTFEYTIQLTKTVLGENKSQKKKARQRFRRSLQQVVEDIDCIWEESTKIQDKGKRVSKEPLVRDFSSSTNDILNVNNNMVGRGDQNEHLLEDLIGSYTGEPKVIPIVGMGGIGKTILAKEVYNHESILRRFDVRVWATVSQQHKIKKILLSLLQSMIKMDDTVKTKDEAKLADMLQKSLKRKRYLIVLDDIWSCEAWDGVRGCFPTEDNTGSRILLTTRNNKVSCYAGTENLSMQMNFMDQDESWNLFKSASFSNEALSSEFETIGKEIADECHGLPITIVVVAGLLNSIREIEDWKSVAKDSSHLSQMILMNDVHVCLGGVTIT